ncbi:RHS repeat-associated core domain-containing protein [Pseudomonas sp. NFX98]|uniref:RHS repeat-associated core domain-containing protein n=1 Tax=Pseudomonas sp. NFX98 TaxID=3399122 RepID=UPI0039FD6DCA
MLAKPKTMLARYQYDALDRLAVHGQPDRLASQRFYCENRLMTEVQGGEWHSIVQHGDQLLAQQKQDSGSIESTLLATDLQRSVLTALSANNPRASAYSPYGHRPGKDGLYSLLGFNGQRSDPVTGHYLLGNGYRAFNPGLMRFNSPDSLSPFAKGGLNAYAYCLGDPVNREDSTGHAPGFSAVPSFLLLRMKSVVKDGVSYKPQRNVTRISKGIFTSEDFTRKGSRITFHAHGYSSGIGAADNQVIGPERLIEVAKESGVDARRFDSVRLLICSSADRGLDGQSIGARLSAILSRPVKAYEGEVFGKDIFQDFDSLKVGERFEGGYSLGITKKPNSFNNQSKNNFNYRPVTFGSPEVRNVGTNFRRL